MPDVVIGDRLSFNNQRLRAHQHLGLDTIEARRWSVLDPDEQREIELAENLDRKDLTTLERSRNVVQLAEVAAEVDRKELRSDSERNSGRGRPIEAGSLRRVAERTGIPPVTIHDARQHVAAVEQYPELAEQPQRVAIAAARTTAAPARVGSGRRSGEGD